MPTTTSDLHLPATEALLRDWCGPVEYRWLGVEIRAVCMGEFDEDGRVLLWREAGDRWAPLSDVRLDLARAECRDRAARVLATQTMDEIDLEYARECGVYWRGKTPVTVEWRALDDPLRVVAGERRWRLASWMSIAERQFVAEPAQVREIGASGFHPDHDPAGTKPDPSCVVVPALADLDPNDDRRLPDGSRWVDALALRLCCEVTS